MSVKAAVADQLPRDEEPFNNGADRTSLVFGPAVIARRSFRHGNAPVVELMFKLANGRRRLAWTRAPADAPEYTDPSNDSVRPNRWVYCDYNPAVLSGEEDARDAVRVEWESM